ncbi:phosphocholine-specific phospholipase C [uncultured Paludibaculum sp.]|uniref:phosphocholine-specific phospholipase C n=1 Tax=uncultured Paludibaculum sp. TaxID=1765020 RepID=UPI002AAA8379|nr:phospholipase C, phosphocholine-specific [uncultured Paludibaculum sp.]
MPSRRDFFKQAAALSGSAALTRSLLASVQRASAIEPTPGTTYLDAEHIVVLMQENRSFDHALGRLRGVRGFNDPRAVELPDGKPVWLQTNDVGATYAPFRLNITQTKATWLGSLPHSWRDQTDARNHGNHDRWLQAKPSGNKDCAGMPLTMGFYDRNDIPFYYAIADAFTVCDQHFCSSLTGTTPNRLYLWTGTVREKPEVRSAPNVRNSEVDYGVPSRWTTFPERLEDAGISWRIYQNELSVPTGFNDEEEAWLANFTDNPIEFFEQFNVGASANFRKELDRLSKTLPAEIDELKKRVTQAGPEQRGLERQLREKEELLRMVQTEKPKWTDEAVARLTPRERALHDKAFTTNTGDPHYRALEPLSYQDGAVERRMLIPKGDVLHQFRKDVESGALPAVSWLVAPERFSDHPGAPWYGAWYVAEALDILTKKPDVWKKTIFILTYDENDGYFDHVPPFVAPDPSNPETGRTSPGLQAELEYLPLEQDLKRYTPHESRGGPVGLGFRVPLVVASPWSRGGFVCSQVFDHTSVLQLMENVLTHRTGKPVRESNITPWRRAVCGDLSSVFRAADGARHESVPFPPRKTFLAGVHKAQFQPLPTGYHRVTPSDMGQYRQNRFAADWMPQQEPGTRPATALPYQLYAEAALSADRSRVELTLKAGNEFFGVRSAGSAFHVYTPGLYRAASVLRTRAYAVAPGGEIQDAWALDGFADNAYHLRVCGPNGFLREFSGTVQDPQVAVHCEYERDAKGAPTGNVVVEFVNHSATQAATVLVRDNSYGGSQRELAVPVNGHQSVTVPLQRSFRWYDLSVTVQGAERYLRRYAGRVENGLPGISDPLMGRQMS